MEREREREAAVKGKDEESGLERRENREVGQRQPAALFVQKDVSVRCLKIQTNMMFASTGRWSNRVFNQMPCCMPSPL